MGKRLSIYKASHGDCSNGGLSGKFDHVLLVTGPDDKDYEAPNAVVLDSIVRGSYRMVPVNGKDEKAIGWMAGGTYVGGYESDGLPFYGAVALHDRQESVALYNAMFD